jgi:hypothetical protein
MKRRLSREDPDRLGPIRSWDTLFRSTESSPDAPDTSAQPRDGQESKPESKAPWEGIASRAIEQGYQVIEEQIREGQRVAEQLRGYSTDLRRVNNDVSRLIERSLRFYTDVGYLWFEFMESVLRNPALAPKEHDSKPESANGNGSGNGAHAAAGHDVEFEISSGSPTSVVLDLKAPATPSFAVPPLRSLDANKPPLTDIRFEHVSNRPVLRIRIPAGQPADTYSGVVVDTRTSQPQGTLCISVRAENALP